MRVTNGIPLGCSLLLPVGTVNCVQTRKGSMISAVDGMFAERKQVFQSFAVGLITMYGARFPADFGTRGCLSGVHFCYG
jgi:hypothetical protein